MYSGHLEGAPAPQSPQASVKHFDFLPRSSVPFFVGKYGIVLVIDPSYHYLIASSLEVHLLESAQTKCVYMIPSTDFITEPKDDGSLVLYILSYSSLVR